MVIDAPIMKKYDNSSFNKIQDNMIVNIGATFVKVASVLVVMIFVE